MLRKKTNVIVDFKPLTSWSYSKYSCYKLCPFQFYCKYILKIKGGPAPALIRGLSVHDDAEKFLKHKVKEVPESCKKLSKEFKVIRKKKYVAEQAWAFDADWNPVPWKEGFLRLKIDAHGFPDEVTGKNIDFKTGKMRDNYQEQVELYTVALFTHYDLEEAITALWYLDHGKVTEDIVYKVDQYEKLVKKWKRKILPMFNDKRFAPTPNYLCNNYCDFANHKSGHCKHGR